MMFHYIFLKLFDYLKPQKDPLPELRAMAEKLKHTIADAKRNKKRSSHLEQELVSVMATIIAIERGIPYRNGSLDWGR